MILIVMTDSMVVIASRTHSAIAIMIKIELILRVVVPCII